MDNTKQNNLNSQPSPISSPVNLQTTTMDGEHPPSFYCPISRQVMHDPVVLSDGHSYERRHIERWLSCKNTSPVAGVVLDDIHSIFPNHSLRNAIEEYFKHVMVGHHRAIQNAAAEQETEIENENTNETNLPYIYNNVNLQRTINSLMETSVLVNADMNAETVLRRIIDEAKQLIGAEVASVFLVDYENQQLYSNVNSTSGEIRIPLSAGIAGHVATSGEYIIIHDAYSDLRFNQNVDKETGFKTDNILCVPIKNKKGIVIGVAQLINKCHGGALSTKNNDVAVSQNQCLFTNNDQKFLSVFASQAASAIANSGIEFEQERKRLSSNQLLNQSSLHQETNKDKSNLPLLFDSFPNHIHNEENLKANHENTSTTPDLPAIDIRHRSRSSSSTTEVTTRTASGGDDNLVTRTLSGASGGGDDLVTRTLSGASEDGDDLVTRTLSNEVYSAVEEEVHIEKFDLSELCKEPEINQLLSEAYLTWETDVLKLEELTNGKPLSTLAHYIFEKNQFYNKFNINMNKFHNFILEIEYGYGKCPNEYHNKAHAASVLHLTHALMKHGGVTKAVAKGQWFQTSQAVDLNTSQAAEQVEVEEGDFEYLASLIAAMIHDYEHPGVNNAFLVKSMNPKSILYNNKHVNEQHHISAAFAILLKPTCYFLNSFNKNEFHIFRQLIIDMVIATDMDENKTILTQLQTSIQSNKSKFDNDQVQSFLQENENTNDKDENIKDDNEQLFQYYPQTKQEAIIVLQMTLKVSDLGHLALPWKHHYIWVLQLEKEFFNQGDIEKTLGFDDVSFLMDRNKPGVTQTQVGFFDFVVLPIFKSFYQAFPYMTPMMNNIENNYMKWKEIENK